MSVQRIAKRDKSIRAIVFRFLFSLTLLFFAVICVGYFVHLSGNFADRCTRPWISSDEKFRLFALQYFLEYQEQNRIIYDQIVKTRPDFFPEFILTDRKWSLFHWSYLRLALFSLPNPYRQDEYSIQVYLQSDECGRIVEFSVVN
jgi:hypothetical protein